jgi:rhodanese-related sulfurtransferase
MKQINYIILGVSVILIGFIAGIATIKITGKYRFKKTAYEMLSQVSADKHRIDLSKAAGMTSDTHVVFVDIRTPKEYDGFHIQNAINIPYERLLDDSYAELLSGDQVKVLYGNTSVGANAAWMILTQFGYTELMVLDGGVNDWITYIGKKDIFKEAYKNDEASKFDYKATMEEAEAK